MLADGRLIPGDQLPTVRQLAADLRVNFNTIARAYRILDEVGLISTQHGRGTYVWEALSEETSHRLRSQSLNDQMDNLLEELLRRGYTHDELKQAFTMVINNEMRGKLEKQSENHPI